MKTYKKPEIELSSFDADIITTSNLTVDTANNGVYKADENAIMTFADNSGKITIDPFKN